MNIAAPTVFQNSNYRLYFTGQSISLIGTWMQKTAVSWLVFSISGSPLLLGISVSLNLFPSAIFAAFGGVVADRYNRRSVLIVTQLLSLIQALALTITVAFCKSIAAIIALSALLGVINAFDVPARQSLLYDLIDDKKSIIKTTAFNSSMVNFSKLAGPALAGIALDKLGAVWCFGLNALSFIAVICFILRIRPLAHPAKRREKTIGNQLLETVQYMKNNTKIAYILLTVLFTSLLITPYTSLLPVVAKDILKGTGTTYASLCSAVGIGALAATILLCRIKENHLNRLFISSVFIIGIALISFSYTDDLTLASILIAIAGFGWMLQITLSMTYIQTSAASDIRGRISAAFIMSWTCMLPIGNIVVTAIAQEFGAPGTICAQGIVAVLFGCIHLRSFNKSGDLITGMPASVQDN